MSNNPNFNNKGGRPVFNHVYEDDELLCYDSEKVIALIGYFAMSPLAEPMKIDDWGICPSVILK